VIETATEAAKADEEFKIQGIEGMEEFVKSMGSSNTRPSVFLVVVVGAIFTLFL
jgi:hypothetical protein